MTAAHPRTTFQCECLPRAWLKPFSFLKQKGIHKQKLHFGLLLATEYPLLPLYLKALGMLFSGHRNLEKLEQGSAASTTYSKDATSGVASTGGEGGTVLPLTAKNLPEIGKKRGKIRKKRGKIRKKIGKKRKT